MNSTSLAAAASQLKNNHTLTSSLGKSSAADSILNDNSYSAGRNTTFQELASMASKAVQDPYEVKLVLKKVFYVVSNRGKEEQ